MRTARIISIISWGLPAILLCFLGLIEDRYELLESRFPEWIWVPGLFFINSMVLGMHAAFLGLNGRRPCLVWLCPVALFLGVLLNCYAINHSETIEIDSAFEGNLTDAEWAALETTGKDLSDEFGSAFTNSRLGKDIGVDNVRIEHSARQVTGGMWTTYRVFVKFRPRTRPRRFRSVPADLAINYFWIKLQFARRWKDSHETAVKHLQTAGNFLVVMRMAGVREPELTSLIHCLATLDPNDDVRLVFSQFERRLGRKASSP